jgi:uncharacterized membrane protein
MSWAVTAVVGSTALGAYQAEEQRKAQAAANRTNAEMAAAQTQYSPWTGMATGQAEMAPVKGDALGGAAQGALGGAMFAQGLKTSAAEQAKLAAETEEIKRQAEMQKQLQNFNPNLA